MSQTERGERGRILAWAEKNGPGREILRPGRGTGSYFEPFDDGDGATEYGFGTLPELRGALMKMWGGDRAMTEAALIASVAAFREKSEDTAAKEGTPAAAKDNAAIPDFVYVF